MADLASETIWEDESDDSYTVVQDGEVSITAAAREFLRAIQLYVSLHRSLDTSVTHLTHLIRPAGLNGVRDSKHLLHCHRTHACCRCWESGPSPVRADVCAARCWPFSPHRQTIVRRRCGLSQFPWRLLPLCRPAWRRQGTAHARPWPGTPRATYGPLRDERRISPRVTFSLPAPRLPDIACSRPTSRSDAPQYRARRHQQRHRAVLFRRHPRSWDTDGGALTRLLLKGRGA